jgi:hypothetical protein
MPLLGTVLNRSGWCSGLFYLRANERTLDLLKRLEDRLSKQK